MKNKCLDCGKEVRKESKRCRSCNAKSRAGKNHPMFGRKGSLHPNYKKPNCCINCGKEISRRSKRCLICANTKERNPNYDKHLTVEQSRIKSKNAMGEKNPFYGKKHTKETKKIQSECKKGKNNPSYGIKRTDKYKKNMSKILMGHTVSEKTKAKISKAHTGKVYSEERKEQMRQTFSGAGNPRWLGGITFEPYGIEFDNKLRNKIRARDKHTCQMCGVKQEDLFRKLSVHHIDYDKKNNAEENLISLCNICHLKTNAQRIFWQGYILGKIHNYVHTYWERF